MIDRLVLVVHVHSDSGVHIRVTSQKMIERDPNPGCDRRSGVVVVLFPKEQA